MKEMNVDISVIIPVYNASVLLRRCLDSVLAQKGNYTYEVLLVDDGSTDDSVEILKSYNNPHFRLFQQENAGPAKARNRGIQEAKGKYLTFIDADDYWEDTFFEETMGFLEKHQECIAVSVGQKHLTLSGESISPACIKDYSESIVIDDFFGFWANWMHVCTGSMMARTDVIKPTGGQRTDLRITEDLEFWALLATKGKWGFIPKILFVSDGTDLVKDSKAWLKKMQIRWNNAPTIGDWERRLIESEPNLKDDDGYKKAIGRVSRNLTYCQLLSGRIQLAREEALKYGNYFTKDSIGKLMNLAKWTPLTWWMLCKFLQYREYHRF